MTRCPLRIVVHKAVSKSHVLAFNTTATVYRRSTRQQQGKPYWQPCGEYYIKYGWYRLPVTMNEACNGFVLSLSTQNFLWVFFPKQSKRKVS